MTLSCWWWYSPWWWWFVITSLYDLTWTIQMFKIHKQSNQYMPLSIINIFSFLFCKITFFSLYVTWFLRLLVHFFSFQPLALINFYFCTTAIVSCHFPAFYICICIREKTKIAVEQRRERKETNKKIISKSDKASATNILLHHLHHIMMMIIFVANSVCPCAAGELWFSCVCVLCTVHVHCVIWNEDCDWRDKQSWWWW